MKELKKWILIVDDEAGIRELVYNILEMNFGDGMKLIEAVDGIDATSRMTFQAFDCIITDLKMPRREGFAFIKSVKESQLNSETPIIVITGYPDDELQRTYPHLKMFTKPFDVDLLADEVKRQMRLGRTDQRVAAGILNGYISGTQKFIEQVLGLESKQSAAGVKRQGDAPVGDVVVHLRFQAGDEVTRFAIGYESRLFSKLIEALPSAQGKSPEFLAETATGIIFKRAARYLTLGSGVKMNLLNCLAVTSKTESVAETLKRSRGVKIPLQTEFGSIFIHALIEPKEKSTKSHSHKFGA